METYRQAAAPACHYYASSHEVKRRPALLYVNTANPAQRPTYQIVPNVLREAVAHHMQLGREQEVGHLSFQVRFVEWVFARVCVAQRPTRFPCSGRHCPSLRPCLFNPQSQPRLRRTAVDYVAPFYHGLALYVQFLASDLGLLGTYETLGRNSLYFFCPFVTQKTTAGLPALSPFFSEAPYGLSIERSSRLVLSPPVP